MVTVHPPLHQRRSRGFCESGVHQIGEEMVGVPALLLAGSGDGEDASRKLLAVFRLVAKANLAPLHSWPQRPLSQVVRGINALVAQENEQVVPVGKDPFGLFAESSGFD